MNKSMLVGSLMGAIAITAGGAVAGYRVLEKPSGAEVVSARALVKTIKTPRQECHDEQVTRTKPAKDTHRLAGTGIGRSAAAAEPQRPARAWPGAAR